MKSRFLSKLFWLVVALFILQTSAYAWMMNGTMPLPFFPPHRVEINEKTAAHVQIGPKVSSKLDALIADYQISRAIKTSS